MFNITELTCRVCLQEQDVLIYIYDELEELNTNLSNLLETCADLQITENDIFPKYLCEDCTRELLVTSKFREKCDKSKEILYKIEENSKVLENEESFANDIIEYCTGDDIDVQDLIIHEPAVESEIEADKLIEEVESEKVDVSVSLLKNNSKKPINATELSSQLENKPALEEPLLPEDCFNHLELVTDKFLEEEVQPIIVSSDNATSLGQKEVNQNLNMPFPEISKRYRLFKCDVCGALFKQAINLQKHFQKSHEAVHCFNCFKCDHWFSIKKELCKHVENCNSADLTTALNADKKIITEKIFATSLEREHSRQCVYCKREFPTPFALRMHIRTHTGERPFQCKFCTKSFKTQSQLNVHHKRHTGQADFICSICNKSFYEQSNLTVHMRSHTGERPHACTICNKTFTRVFLLQFHMRTHTGEKPYKCNFCDKRFRQQTDLSSHLSIHTGQKKHTCIMCGKSYAKRSHLAQHMPKHLLHNDRTEKDNGMEFKNDHITEELSNGYDNQNYSFEELSTATDNIQNYVQNTKIVYSFDEIIQCEDVVTE